MTPLRVFIDACILLAAIGAIVSVPLGPGPVLAVAKEVNPCVTNTATHETETAKLAHEYSGRYWDLGNMITAFTVVQMLGFLYALGEKKTILKGVREQWPWVVGGTIVSGPIYGWLIYWCYSGEKRALSELCGSDSFIETSELAMHVRWLIIVIMTCFGVASLLLDKKSNPT